MENLYRAKLHKWKCLGFVAYRTNVDLLVKKIEAFQKYAVVIESEVLSEASAER